MINVELRRYIWRNSNPSLLMLAPGVVTVVLTLFYLLPELSGRAKNGMPALLDGLAMYAVLFTGMILVVSACGKALGDEVAERTWDFQRMSNQRPLAILLGKLFGAPLYGWYVILCIALGYLAMTRLYRDASGLDDLAHAIIAVFCASIAALAVGIFFSRSHERHRIENFAARLAGALAGTAVYMLLQANLISRFMPIVLWYGQVFLIQKVIAGLIIGYVGWILVSALYALRANLRYPPSNWPWLLFFAFHSAFIYGFDLLRTLKPAAPFLVMAVTGLILSLTALVFENVRADKYRRIQVSLRARKYRRAFHELPKWIVALVYVGLTLSALFITAASLPDRAQWVISGLMVTNAALFFVRDAILFHAFVMGSRGWSATVTFFTAIFVYYLIVLRFLPWPLNPFALNQLRAFQNGQYDISLLPVLCSLAQVAVVLLLCRRRLSARISPPAIVKSV